jgi:hypothetical protein
VPKSEETFMPVETAKVKVRRQVSYGSLQDVLADAQRLSRGNIKSLGNWSAGQVFLHLARAMNSSIDGTDANFPLWLCVMARLFKKKLLAGPMPPGFQLPARAAETFVPGPTSTEEGLAALQAAIARQERESSRAPSPVFGKITRDEWNQIHLMHSTLHMSFLTSA